MEVKQRWHLKTSSSTFYTTGVVDREKIEVSRLFLTDSVLPGLFYKQLHHSLIDSVNFFLPIFTHTVRAKTLTFLENVHPPTMCHMSRASAPLGGGGWIYFLFFTPFPSRPEVYKGEQGRREDGKVGCLMTGLELIWGPMKGPRKKLHGKGTYKHIDRNMDIATTSPKWPSGPSQWEKKEEQIFQILAFKKKIIGVWLTTPSPLCL